MLFSGSQKLLNTNLNNVFPCLVLSNTRGTEKYLYILPTSKDQYRTQMHHTEPGGFNLKSPVFTGQIHTHDINQNKYKNALKRL